MPTTAPAGVPQRTGKVSGSPRRSRLQQLHYQPTGPGRGNWNGYTSQTRHSRRAKLQRFRALLG